MQELTSMESQRAQRDPRRDVARQDARRRQLRAVDEELSDDAQQPAGDKRFQIVHRFTPYTR